MRTKLFLHNTFFIMIAQVSRYFMDFLCRTVFIRTLSTEYLGVTGLFTNILSVLSISELGIGTVLVYSMYKPLADHDEDKLLSLILLYKRAYTVIALVIGGIGLILIPFLPMLIKDAPDISNLSFIYVLYLSNSVFSYLFAYKHSIFAADQRLYITQAYKSVVLITKDIFQIIILITTHNFILYLLIQLPFTLLTNLLLSRKAEKLYPFIKSKKKSSLAPSELKEIKKNIFAMFHHRIGLTILNSTDNLILSRFVGLTMVAVNANYTLILNMINFLTDQVFSALTSSVGNYNATKSSKDSYNVFCMLHFCSFWFYTFCATCLFILFNPFVSLVWGEDLLFSTPIVAIICINFYIVGIRKIPITFKESMGLLWHDRYKPIIEASINLILSLIAVKILGAFGVFLGTFISMVSTSLWVEPRVLFKHGFHLPQKDFWLSNLKYFTLSLVCLIVTNFVANLYTGSAFITFLYKIVICILVPNLLLLLIFFRTKLFRSLLASLYSLQKQ